jgi:hypothetical protein
MKNNKKYNNTISFPLSSELQHCQQNKINSRSYVGSNTDVKKYVPVPSTVEIKENINPNFVTGFIDASPAPSKLAGRFKKL